MPKHRRGVLTLYQPATPLRPAGYGSTGPSPALALLDVTHGHALGVRRLGSGTVALVTGPAVLLQQPSSSASALRTVTADDPSI